MYKKIILMLFILIINYNAFAEKNLDIFNNCFVENINEYFEQYYDNFLKENKIVEFIEINGKKYFINYEIYEKYKFIVYGNQYDIKNNPINKKGHRRFIGYNIRGEYMPNPLYGDDYKNDVSFGDFNYISVKDYGLDEINKFNLKFDKNNIIKLNDKFVSYIKYSIKKEIFSQYREEKYLKNFDRLNLKNIVYILQYPTKYNKGLVLLYHKVNNVIWYKYFEIPEFEKEMLIKNVNIIYDCDDELSDIELNSIKKNNKVYKLNFEDDIKNIYVEYEQIKGFYKISAEIFLKNDKNEIIRKINFDNKYKISIYEIENSIKNIDVIFKLKKNNSLFIPKLNSKLKIYSNRYDVLDKIPVQQDVNILINIDKPIILEYSYNLKSSYKNYNAKIFVDNIEYMDVKIEKTFSYYVIENLVLFKLYEMQVVSDIFGKDIIYKNLFDIKYNIKKYQEDEHILETGNIYSGMDKEVFFNIYLSKEKFDKIYDIKKYVNDYIGDLKVRNDRIEIDGNIIMDDNYENNFTNIPNKFISKEFDYLNSEKIYKKLKNGVYNSYLKLEYKKIFDINNNLKIYINNIMGNDVNIFTPASISSNIYLDENLDQRSDFDMNKKNGIKAFPIASIMRVEIDNVRNDFENKFLNSDEHIEKNTIIADFPFYLSYDEKDLEGSNLEKFYIKENSEIILRDKLFFIKLPTFVEEKIGNIYLKTYAKNFESIKDLNFNNYKYEKNYNNNEYIVYNNHKLDLTGRIFDLAITNSSDENFNFLNYKKYLIGNKDLNGKLVYLEDLILPLGSFQNKNNIFFDNKYVMGHKIEINLKTYGDYYKKYEYIRMKPTYYHIDFDGNRKEVDLYYKKDDYYVKSGSLDDNYFVKYIFNENKFDKIDKMLKIYRIIDEMKLNNLIDTDYGYNDYFISVNNVKRISRTDLVGLTTSQRLFIGNKVNNKVNDIKQIISEQSWYGGFEIPKTSKFLEKDKKNLDIYLDNDLFLKEGYIIINFSVELIKNKDILNPRLSFISNTHNSFKTQGFNFDGKFSDKVKNFKFLDGDLIIIDLGKNF